MRRDYRPIQKYKRFSFLRIILISFSVLFFWYGMSFNLMTLGGIAAAIGLIIDDAIVVVEAIHSKVQQGVSNAIAQALTDIVRPLLASTLTIRFTFPP